jgi:hypothetical protein
MDDEQLGTFTNILGVVVVILLVAYHFVVTGEHTH